MMKPVLLSLAVLIPSIASADFVPTLTNAPRICPDRPAKPDWMTNFNVTISDSDGRVAPPPRATC